MVLLGIDIGTSACKVAAFYPDGTVAAQSTKAYKVYYPRPGWAEQDPDEWYKAVCEAIREILNIIPAEDIAGIGVDGQSWSCIPVDKNKNALARTPIWLDTRAQEECKVLCDTIGEDKIFSVCKNPVQANYTTPKALWFKHNCPDVYNNAVSFLQCNSFIVYRLTDILSQDASQGYGHFFYDMAKGTYDEDLCRETGLDISKYPKIFQCCDIVGKVTEKASAETGLKAGTPVAAGGLDAACGTLGAGVINPGQTQEQGGQAGGMSICCDEPTGHKSLILGNHVVPGRWLLQGGTTGGGGVMKWFSEQFGSSFGKDNILKNIDGAAAEISPGSDGLVFLPYMSGERSPIWNPNAKGVFFGLSFDKTRAHTARSVMEGVAFSLRHNLDTAYSAGASVGRLYAMGGSANSRVWTQIKSDITGLPIDVPGSDTATTLGAAILAGVGTGVYTDFSDAVSKTIKIRRTHLPNANTKAVYDKNYQTYLKLYESLKELM